MFMIAETLSVRDLSEAWFMCLRHVLDNGYMYRIDRGSFAGQQRKEFDYVTIQVTNPGIRPLIPDVPPGVPAPTTMVYIEEDYLPYLMSSYKAGGEEYTYGTYLEPQIPVIIEMLKNSPRTNQAYMTVGDPSTVYMADPPCLRGIQAQIKYGQLHFMVYFRSWDLWGGFPSNLAALQLLKEHMAREIGIPDGQLIASSAGLHIYDHAWELARMVVDR